MAELNASLFCRNCGLRQRFSIPSSPTPYLHRTLQAPDASEADVIRQTLSHAKSQLSQLEDEISQLRALVRDLSGRSHELHEFIEVHKTFLSPIRRLPLEILAEIFAYCIPTYLRSSGRSLDAPLLLGQVCVGWRKAALSTQKLWSSISVSPRRHFNESLAKVWLSRTISSPLSITLDGEYHDLPVVKRMWPGISRLIQYCDRWKYLEIRLPPPIIQRLHSIKYRLPWLESLRIRTQISSYPWSEKLDIFEYAPRLHILYLDHGVPHSVFKIPWNQLTELHARFEDVDGCLSALQLTPNLMKCVIYCKSWGTASALSHHVPVVQLPYLLFFFVSVVQSDMLFSHVQLPNLYDLHVEYPDNIDDPLLSVRPFLSLLPYSSHALRNLTIDGLSYSQNSAQIVHCLRSTPSLIQLTLLGADGWLTVDLLLPLTCQGTPTAESCLVPRLEMLELSDSTTTDICAFADMIESRWQILENEHKTACLRTVRLTLYDVKVNIIDVQSSGRLHKFRNEGMDIRVIIYKFPKDWPRPPDPISDII